METKYILSLLFAFIGYASRLGGDKMRWDKHPDKMQYNLAFDVASKRYGIPDGLLARVAYQESTFNSQAVSPVGARGLMQFMPPTAKDFGIDPLNPYESIDAAGKYLKQLKQRTGSWRMALAAYNWGMGNLSRKGYENAPLETRNYVNEISRDTGVV